MPNTPIVNVPLPFLSCIILAAGESKRLNTAKQLLDWHGETLLAKAIRELQQIPREYAAMNEIIVVLGARYEEIIFTLSPFNIITCKNNHWSDGMGSSISTAMQSVNAEASAVLLTLCDQPLLTTRHYEQLLNEFILGSRTIASAQYGGSAGAPAIFAKKYFAQLAALDGEKGAKSILHKHPDDVTLVEFPTALIDIDTADDYARAIAEYGKVSSKVIDEIRSYKNT